MNVFVNWTLAFPRCTQRVAHGQCVANHRHHGACNTESGFKWFPDMRVTPLPIAEFARHNGIRL